MSASVRQLPYEQRLRSIGSSLDSGGYHSVSIIEVDDGLIVRASAPGSRTPEVLEVQDDGVAIASQLAPMRVGVPHRLFSEGYKGFLAALGRRLDRSEAAAIAIVEGTDFVTVGGIRLVSDGEEEMTYEQLDILLLAEDIQAIMVKPEPETPGGATPVTSSEPSKPTQKGPFSANVVNRVTAVIDSALRMISSTDNPARMRS